MRRGQTGHLRSLGAAELIGGDRDQLVCRQGLHLGRGDHLQLRRCQGQHIIGFHRRELSSGQRSDLRRRQVADLVRGQCHHLS